MTATNSIRTALTVVLLLLAACSGDSIPFSFGRLEGNLAPTPSNWSAVAGEEVIRLETNPDDPYAVNLWVIGMDDALYVHAGANRATWVEHMEANPSVRLEADGSIYRLTAERVTEQVEFDAFSEIYQQKYGRYPRNRNVAEAYLFRLGARQELP